MAVRHDPMQSILTNLMRRIEGLGDMRASLSGLRLLDEIDEIEHLARRFGLADVEGLASMLGSAVTLHGLGPILLSYLDLMRDAVAARMEAGRVAAFVPPALPVAALSLRA